MQHLKRTRRLGRTRYRKAYNLGYDKAFNAGWDQGIAAYYTPLQLTSIIIPTYNQLNYLKLCLESIRAKTPEPYELIVIDSGSTDDTAAYLKSFPFSIRYRLSPQNLGFAGAVNQGLMMARGTAMVILNNDTLVTDRWLTNLLSCVNSDAGIGLAGPVTNYISGDQQIPVTYESIPAMQDFAASYNHSDPDRWQRSNRIMGFCLIMKREMFQRLGYLDEGFEIGNCEDDDYTLRTRLLGFGLCIVGDTFIHHFGSVSMKSLGTEFDQVYQKNLNFYATKWRDPYGLLNSVLSACDAPRQTVDFYPSHIAARGIEDRLYWIESGIRYVLEGSGEIPAARISHVDLRAWPLGGTLSIDLIRSKLEALNMPTYTEGYTSGVLLQSPDGLMYQYDQGKLRRIINENALNAWSLQGRSVIPITLEAKNSLDEGIPIIAPPIIRANNL